MVLGRFERLLERAVEGGLRRVLPTHLQPVQIAKAAARAMEDAQVVGLRGTEVPNQYVVRISEADMARFADYRTTLEAEIERYLAGYARDRGLLPAGAPRVQLVQSADVATGGVQADARFVGLPPARQGELEQALEGTRQLRLALARESAGAAGETAGGYLEDASGRRYELRPSDGTVRLGRSLDNDVVVADPRVSRYHAQLRWDGRHWLVYDLQSTNGTFVGGVRVGGDPVPLVAPGSLAIGNQHLRYSAVADPAGGTGAAD